MKPQINFLIPGQKVSFAKLPNPNQQHQKHPATGLLKAAIPTPSNTNLNFCSYVFFAFLWSLCQIWQSDIQMTSPPFLLVQKVLLWLQAAQVFLWTEKVTKLVRKNNTENVREVLHVSTENSQKIWHLTTQKIHKKNTISITHIHCCWRGNAHAGPICHQNRKLQHSLSNPHDDCPVLLKMTHQQKTKKTTIEKNNNLAYVPSSHCLEEAY